MSKILVAIPCYNCEIQIKRVIAGFDENLLDKIEKVIIIDNQSKDDTINSAINAIKTKTIGHDKFNVFRNDNNYGLGGSHKVAFNFGFENGMDYVIILHGDDQAKTQEINNFISEIERNDELAAILGSRFMKNSKLYGYSFFRTYGNIALNFLFTVLTFRRIKDLGSGLNIFKLDNLQDKRYLKFSDDLTFNIDLLLDYYYKKTNIKFFPISWTETDQISNAKAFNIGYIAMRSLFVWLINPDKLKEDFIKNYSSTKIK